MSTSIDHLDASPSETVRRHAATFRRVREARQAAAEKSSDELSDELRIVVPAREAGSDEMPTTARRLAQLAEASGWAVSAVHSVGAAGAWSLRCRRSDGTAMVGYWRAPVPVPPMKWKWGWAFGLVATPGEGLRSIGAREAKALLSDESAGVALSDEKL